MPRNVYLTGEYLEKNPEWHSGEAPWKAKYILRMLSINQLTPRTIGEVGCGTGEVLRQLQLQMDPECVFTGYDISPQAIELSQSRQNAKLQCHLADACKEQDECFDLLLILDVLEHLEDYFSFLRQVRSLGRYKLFHFPLDLSMQTVLRKDGLMKRRRMYGHLHYFTKDLALQCLTDEEYRVLNWFYAPRQIELATAPLEKVLRWPRILSFAIHEDIASRLLGGFSLFVLAE